MIDPFQDVDFSFYTSSEMPGQQIPIHLPAGIHAGASYAKDSLKVFHHCWLFQPATS
jgi:hypothetical protein